jgi:hypothetical protein
MWLGLITPLAESMCSTVRSRLRLARCFFT